MSSPYNDYFVNFEYKEECICSALFLFKKYDNNLVIFFNLFERYSLCSIENNKILLDKDLKKCSFAFVREEFFFLNLINLFL